MVWSVLRWLMNIFLQMNEEGPGYVNVPCPWAATSYPSPMLWLACLCCPTLAFLTYKLFRSGYSQHEQQPGRQEFKHEDNPAHKQPPRWQAPKAGHVPTSSCFCAGNPNTASQFKVPTATPPMPSPVLYRSSTRSEVCSAKVDAHPGLDSSQVRHAFSSAARYHLKEMEKASGGMTFNSWQASVSGCVQLLVWSTGLAEGALTRFAQWREVRRAQQQQQQQQQQQYQQQQQSPLRPAPQPQQQLAQVPEEIEVVPEMVPFDKTSLEHSTAQAEKQQQQGHEGSSSTYSVRFSDDSAMQERWSSENTSLGGRTSDDSAYSTFNHHVHTLLQAPLGLNQSTSVPRPALPAAAPLPTSSPSPPLPASQTPSAAASMLFAPPLTNLSLLHDAMCAALPELSALPVRAQAEGKNPMILGRQVVEGMEAEQLQLSEQPIPTPPPTAAPIHFSRSFHAAFQAFSQAPTSQSTLPTATPTIATAAPGLSSPGFDNEVPPAPPPAATASTTTIKLLSANPCVFDSRQALLASQEVEVDLSVESNRPSVTVRVVVMSDNGAALVDVGHELRSTSIGGASSSRRGSSSSRGSSERGRASGGGGRASTSSWGSGERGRGRTSRSNNRGEHSIRVHIPPLSLDMYDDDLNTCNLKLCVLPSQPAGAFSATVTLSSRAATALSSESNTAEAHRFGSPIQPLLYGSCTLLVLPRDACQELQHGLFPRMCAAVEQEELERVGVEPNGSTSSETTATPSSASSLTAGNLAAGASLQPSAAPSFASTARLPVFAAGALGSAAHKAWLLHFQPFIADLELLLRAHHTFKQQQRQQTGESVTEQEALERGTGMQHTAADTGDAALMSENANVDAWADSAPDVLQFLAAELRGFVEGAGNLTAVQQLLQRLVLPS